MHITHGGFGGMVQNPRISRVPVNEMDRCTIVSIYPADILEIKPTIFPGTFYITGCKDPDTDFELLVVGPSSWWKEIDESQPYLEIPTSSMAMAKSVIQDFANGLVDCNMSDRMPGLFFIPGNWTKKKIPEYFDPKSGVVFQELLTEARKKQRAWFEQVVITTDVDWARSGGNPRTISQQARMAADYLGIAKAKPWMVNFTNRDLAPCKACGELINPAFPVCRHCHAVIDEDKAKSLGIKFAV